MDWKRSVAEANNVEISTIPQVGILQCTRLIPLENLASKQIYSILIRKRDCIPTAKLYFDRKFPDISQNNWLQINLLARKTTKNLYARIFQYKILNNILYLNKKLSLCGLADSSLCSFCRNVDEDTTHLFSDCRETTSLWGQLQTALSPSLSLPALCASHALLGFYEDFSRHSNLVNHLLLIFKMHVYMKRNSRSLSVTSLLSEIKEIANLEINFSTPSTTSNIKYLNKWRPINDLVMS